MKNIKEILQNYEATYNHKDWLRLKKDLHSASKIGGATKTILISSVIIATIVSTVLLINSFNSNKKETSKIETISNLKENENNINQEVKEFNILDKTDTEKITNHQTKNTINNKEQNFKTEESNSKNPIIKNADTQIQDKPEQTQTTTENSYSEKTKSSNKDNLITDPETIDLDKILFSVELIETCIPAKVKFYAINCPESCEILWNLDKNTKISGNNIEYSYLKAGKYQPEVFIIHDGFIIKTEKLNNIEINKPTEIKINFDNSENLYYFTCNKVEGLNLLWSIDNQQFSGEEVSYSFNKEGDYMINLKGINKFGCKSEVSEKIIIKNKPVFYVPNAFIPNSDDINSHFGPIGENLDFASYQLMILDANGIKVFESDKPDFMWNGKINNIGNEAKPGVYLWEIKTLDNYGNYHNKKGRVNLIRK
ncbi:MAG: gliding motility-associated C-terminal domain-containing protein [Bacteroidales bacterium]|nr:gliding motility-associated C-terminal domain-containing protein [Bacteroidales bacterium]MDY0315990.1 gliding motility-associated C-terminal domain-containing protein [Bacteroidales bacterium]